jgi:hypothetical protein
MLILSEYTRGYISKLLYWGMQLKEQLFRAFPPIITDFGCYTLVDVTTSIYQFSYVRMSGSELKLSHIPYSDKWNMING